MVTLEQIKEEVNKKNIPASSIANPIFGWLFESTGCLQNLRFYSPLLKFGTDENGRRKYVEDTSDDSFIKSVIALFPSPVGVLCHITTANSNFARNFNESKEDGIAFLAQLFIAVSRDKEINANFLIRKAQSFKSLAKSLLQDDNMSFPDSEKQLKLLLIHAFIINMLDKSEDLSLYLEMILKGIENTKQELELDLFDEVTKARDSLNFFPYSQLNPPLSQVLIPIYKRETDTFDYEKNLFSDCADVTLLHLCNCLFYDSREKKYSVNHLNLSADARIREFYNKHPEPFALTLDIRKDWSRVIQDLPDFKEKDESKYRTDLIVYVQSERNEVSAGIINMMNVLAMICGIDNIKLWDGLNDSNLDEKLEWLLNELIDHKKNTTIRVKSSDFTKYRSKDIRYR